MKIPFFFSCAFILLAFSPVNGEDERLPTVQTEILNSEFEDLDGDKLTPLKCREGEKASVVIFTTVDCPIANAYQPAIMRLRGNYSEELVSLTLVHVDPDVDKGAARKHAEEFKIGIPVVMDPDHKLVDATGAEITPEAVVAVPGGRIVYRGRIDDWYSELGQRRRAPRTRELADVLDALIKGEEPKVKPAPAIGCYIADFRKSEKKD